MKKPSAGRKASGLRVYSNLSARRKQKADVRSRRKAEYLATLPKHPVKRFLYRLHPRRFFAYWFSREGGIMALKIAGVSVILFAILIGALFAYFRRELDAIRPGEISKRVQTTVTRYYDRNGVLLWEDKGDGDYKLVVDSKNINQYMKDATVALEDKDFYRHPGISVNGIFRATINNFSGGDTQGASTLTQQLIKSVFFADEASKRGLNGVPRKIKEIILAIEVERMYNKDQILTLYLNEAPYGGRRAGVESAAQTYFGKTAKDVTLAEAALLAAIPQQPTLLNPYTIEGNKTLLARQQTTLDKMAEQGYITRKAADEAKKVAILDTLKPEFTAQENIRAPHFVLDVRAQLEKEFGQKLVRSGGLNIKTTLDYRAQEVVEKAMTNLFNSAQPKAAGFNNAAATVVDVPTGQILAMQGSRDYNHPGYGYFNSSTSFLQPGSSIKPLVYAGLFKQKPGLNYGAGTTLSDEPIPQSIYKTDDGKSVQNFDLKFRGKISIRSALAESRNIPAIKAMYLNGRDPTLQTIKDLGDKSYCTDGRDTQVGLGASIGGCGLKQYEHVNTFATLARGGVYKEPSSILEVRNGQGQVIKQWKDNSKQVIDPQIPYIISDILSDDAARAPSFGRGARGLNVAGVKTATKTGTSNIGNRSKDLWMMSYSPKVAMGIWAGNHDSTPLKDALSYRVGPTVSEIMEPLHKEIFQKDGTWKPGDWFQKPAGVQSLNVDGRTDLFPSWYTKPQSSTTKVTFDKVSKKKATTCTPARAKIDLDVQKIQDPVTKQDATIAPDGYDAGKDDDIHKCDDVKPFVSLATQPSTCPLNAPCTIKATVNQGTHPLQTLEIYVDGLLVSSQPVTADGQYTVEHTFATDGAKISAIIIDAVLYEGTVEKTADVAAARTRGSDRRNRERDNFALQFPRP